MSELGKEKRRLNFRHGACIGHVVMARKNMMGVVQSPTTTAESKAIAKQIISDLVRLEDSLKERGDHNDQ